MNTDYKSIVKVFELGVNMGIGDVQEFRKYYMMCSSPIIYRSYSFTESARVHSLLNKLGFKHERFSTYDGPHVFVIEGNITIQEQIKDAVKQAQEQIEHKVQTGDLLIEGYDVGSKSGSN